MADDEGAPPPAPALDIDGCRVLVGTCSWTDATLVKETDWYPRRTMTAAQRLAYYASRFPVVEVDSTYYFPPTPELSATWVQRTPDDFTINIKAWSLLTGHPTFHHSLWPDLQGEIPAEHRDKRRLYATHLPPDVVDEAWDRFRHSLMPLHSAGRLGAVLLQYPRWFGPKEANREEIRQAACRLPDFRLCVEFRNGRWIEGNECESTLGLLESLGLSFVCVDEPAGFPSSVPPVVATTADLAVVRFHGRNAETWEGPVPSAAERFRYHYRSDELREWLPKVRELAASAREVHLLMNNCYRDYGVDNAAELITLLQT
ncbi:MAG TPA: DUF72 domain-containing protein [Acidimicrobiales bacterium]|jgi:uncharacterized protein YecE (DUF72 family)|nr:DUF72 domain-containing protein [Acidimicrobiales bacterium]